MEILGHGVDVVDATRFEKLFAEDRERHLVRYFTKRELDEVSKERGWQMRLAARFAAKEAIMKAIEHGFGDGLAFTDIEIGLNEEGVPTPILHGKALSRSTARGIERWWLSMSHSGNFAVASAIACG